MSTDKEYMTPLEASMNSESAVQKKKNDVIEFKQWLFSIAELHFLR